MMTGLEGASRTEFQRAQGIWRGLAARYDRLAIVYRATVVLSACIIWTRHMGDAL
jgi:hypothetical protein